jgi:hypothetical protein
MTKTELLECLYSWENLELLIRKFETQPKHIRTLMELALTSHDPKSWRAAWIAEKIYENHPKLLRPWLDPIIYALESEKHPAKKRHFLKHISLNEPAERHHSFLLDFCLKTFTSAEEPIAVRVYAMQILFNISEKEPGFKPELLSTIENEIELHPSAGICSRGRKLKKELIAQMHRKRGHKL